MKAEIRKAVFNAVQEIHKQKAAMGGAGWSKDVQVIEVARLLGLERSVVWNAMRWLRKYGLVEGTTAGWVPKRMPPDFVSFE